MNDDRRSATLDAPPQEDGPAADEATRPWHTLPVATALSRLGTGLPGLAGDDAARRLVEWGPNELAALDRVSAWRLLFAQFQNVLILILLLAAVLSAFMGHGLEAVAITAILLLAVVLGFVQEYRAERAIEALRRMAAPVATARRDGEERPVAARDLVPGDVVLLEAGSRVPADARLLEVVSLEVDEATLTGESFPVHKTVDALTAVDLAVGDRTNMLYAGTTVTHGRGTAVVVATGMRTEFGRIARLLQSVESRRTPLQENLDRVGAVLARVAVAMVALIVLLGILRGQPFGEMLVFGIALAVAVVPEALPAVVTISLALGAQRMVRRHALVRRLSAVETLGSVSVIASDKTGTLTRGEMTCQQVQVAGRSVDLSGRASHRRDPPLEMLLQAAVLASDARRQGDSAAGGSLRGDPTEVALIVAAENAGLDMRELERRLPRVAEIPFSAEAKRMTTLHRAGDGLLAFAKGAPEVVVAACDRMLGDEGERPFGAREREQSLQAARQMAAQALRLIAVAAKRVTGLAEAERGMTFLGLVGMSDPPRPEAKSAIATCERAGIKPIMITGDHAVTAQAVARALGLLRQGRLVTGADLDAMGEADLRHQVDEIEVYARVSPEHKLRVVAAWQDKGRYVAMTGDGVNDAPALKKADIGVAMGLTGTDVTKDAAALTLTDDNFASIVAAVEEGRGVFSNVKKYLMYLLSSNVGEIGLMAGASVLGLPLPLTAVQILYVNLATDGLPAVALSVDPPEADLMQRPPRDPRRGIFTRPVVALTALGGAWSMLANLALFVWALGSGRSAREATTMTFVSLVLIELLKAYHFRSDRHSVFVRPFANRWLNLAIGWELLALASIVYVPALGKLFGTFPLSVVDWAVVVGVALTISPVLETAKWALRRGWFGSPD
jgi:P-type Ca2+ transporter type 2C